MYTHHRWTRLIRGSIVGCIGVEYTELIGRVAFTIRALRSAFCFIVSLRFLGAGGNIQILDGPLEHLQSRDRLIKWHFVSTLVDAHEAE